MNIFPADRESALQRLHEFVQDGASAYARTRNFVKTGHGNVSRLSAALRHRLISEEEVVAAVLAVHCFPAVEKFVQEVVWRTYWKGWLEQHPGVWADYVGHSAAYPLPLPSGGAMSRFTAELRATGYVHNHARMWWAGWWCHQLGLPWAAGARFFFDHLLDADAASNTLGWRWVAGLQTPGKAYFARRDNVAKYWEDHAPLEGISDCVSARIPVETADRSRVAMPDYPESYTASDAKIALLGHPDDLSLETTPLGGLHPAAIALIDEAGETDSAVKKEWRKKATDDAASRWSQYYGVKVELLPRWVGVLDWVKKTDCKTLVLMAPFVGPDADCWVLVRETLKATGIELIECRRAWDTRLFPAARAGFFPFWHKVRRILLKSLLPNGEVRLPPQSLFGL